MPTALIGLGSNLGDRRQWLDQAVQQLAASSGISSVRASSWQATPAIGGPAGQPDFLNGAAVVETSLSAELLWARLREIETALGRVRRQPWGPRTIDLDLLLYDQHVLRTPQLELPHPRMAFRRFVLQPTAEIAGDFRHPTIGWTISELLHHLDTAVLYVAISGSLFRATQQLSQAAAAKTGCELIEFAQDGAETAPLGSPSLGLEQTIEFLRQQASLLAQHKWPAEGRGCISSFWIEDLLAVGEVLWPGALDEVWQSIGKAIVRPKLLAVYEADSQQFQREGDSQQKTASGVAIALWHRLNEARRARVARPGIGPVLWLDAVDPAAAEKELVAAIQAMD